jgi:tetraacyldisaccharide 4'-kinase
MAWSFPAWTGSTLPVFLNKKRVVAFAGIGNPRIISGDVGFTGRRGGCDFCGFKDHYAYQKDDLDRLVRLKAEEEAQYILTTEKDWVRMGQIWPECSEIAYLSIHFSFLPGQEGVFRMIENAFREK